MGGEAHLWRWAAMRLGNRRICQLETHYDTAAFIDAVHTASHFVQRLMPFARGAAHLRHFFRGTKPPDELGDFSMLENWNGSDGFCEGAKEAHRSLLKALWRPIDQPLWPQLRQSLGPEAVRWLADARKAHESEALQQVRKCSLNAVSPDAISVLDGSSAESDASAELRSEEPRKVTSLSVRLERLHGPQSLECIREMSVTGWRSVRDPEVMEVFHRDTLRGDDLNLEVAAVSESSSITRGDHSLQRVLRRYDRLRLVCNFNLREGIASPFRIAAIEELCSEELELPPSPSFSHSEWKRADFKSE